MAGRRNRARGKGKGGREGCDGGRSHEGPPRPTEGRSRASKLNLRKREGRGAAELRRGSRSTSSPSTPPSLPSSPPPSPPSPRASPRPTPHPHRPNRAQPNNLTRPTVHSTVRRASVIRPSAAHHHSLPLLPSPPHPPSFLLSLLSPSTPCRRAAARGRSHRRPVSLALHTAATHHSHLHSPSTLIHRHHLILSALLPPPWLRCHRTAADFETALGPLRSLRSRSHRLARSYSLPAASSLLPSIAHLPPLILPRCRPPTSSPLLTPLTSFPLPPPPLPPPPLLSSSVSFCVLRAL